MKSIEINALAKINLGLNVVEKREDGYHNLETVFYPLYDLHDKIYIKKSDKFNFSCDNFQIKKLVHNFVRLENTGELVEDKMFYVISAQNPTGELINCRGGNNEWIDIKDFSKIDKKYYDEDNILAIALQKENLEIEEETFFIKEF